MFAQVLQRLLGSIKQQLVAKQVGACVARHTQLGHHHDVCTRLNSLVHALDDVSLISFNVSHIDLWHNSRHTHQTIIGHHIVS